MEPRGRLRGRRTEDASPTPRHTSCFFGGLSWPAVHFQGSIPPWVLPVALPEQCGRSVPEHKRHLPSQLCPASPIKASLAL